MRPEPRTWPTQKSEARLYYIQNKGFVGNCLLWWKPEGSGYTCDLNEAWKVDYEKATSLIRTRCGEDIMWPVSFVDANSQRHATERILNLNPIKQFDGRVIRDE